jgi:ribonuclease J
VTAGAVLVDGLSAVDGVDGVVLRDRRALSVDGVVTVALTVASATGRAVSGPDLTGRGFLPDPNDPLMEEARAFLARELEQAGEGQRAEPGYLKAKIHDELSRFFYEKTHRRPMILPIVLEV